MPLPLEERTTEQLKLRRAELVKQIDEGRFKLAHRVIGRERSIASSDVHSGRLERNAIDVILKGREKDASKPPPADTSPSVVDDDDDTPPEPIIIDDGVDPSEGDAPEDDPANAEKKRRGRRRKKSD